MAAALLETHGLGLHAAGRCLLQGLDWQVLPGQRWCLIGRNAAGKSTLLRALAGLAVPQRSGRIRWQGRDQADWSAADAAFLRAYAPQHPADRFALSVGRLLALSQVRSGLVDVLALLAGLDAGHLAERSLAQLSGGERQRIALAQAAAQGAALWLLDEPVSFQDPAHQGLLADWLRDFACARAGTGPGDSGDRAWVASAHDINWTLRSASHVLALLGDGGWVAGPVAEIIQAPLLRQVYGCDWRDAGGVWVAQ